MKYNLKLKNLNLSKNENILIEGIKELTHLEALDLGYTNRKELGEEIQLLTNLKELYLRSNEKISIEGIKNLTNLEVLDWGYTNRKRIRRNKKFR